MASAASWERSLKPVRHRWADPLSKMDPLEFERLMGRYFEGQGYRVDHVGTGGRATRFDGGIDLMLSRGDERIAVQCKRWTACQVPHTDVHQLLGIIRTADATGGIFVTSGEFTRAAVEKMRGITEIRLIEGQELRRMLGAMLDWIPEPVALVPVDADVGLSAPSMNPPPHKSTEKAFEPLPYSRSRRNDIDWGPLIFGTALVLVVLATCVRSTTGRGEQATVQRRQFAPVSVEPAKRRLQILDRQVQASPPSVVPANVPRPGKVSAQEALEATRRANEAMGVIEGSTPEM